MEENKSTNDNLSVNPNRQKSRPFIIRAGKRLRGAMNKISTSQSLIPTQPLISSEFFPWSAELIENWEIIAQEARSAIRHRDAVPPLKDISPDHARIAADGNWRSFFLVGYGYELAENCARAPRTAELVREIPDLNSAFFSILEPGAVIPRHRGVSRGLVTCHLGLIVPTDHQKCTMLVEDTVVHWQAGKSLFFDDSYVHEVHNDTGEQRIILLIQIKRPMRLLGRIANDLMLWAIRRSPFVQDARRNLGSWEQAYKNAERNEAA